MINEHFESDFNAAEPTQIVFQHAARLTSYGQQYSKSNPWFSMFLQHD